MKRNLFLVVVALMSGVLLQGCASAKLANQAALTAAADARASELGDNSELAVQRAKTAHETAVNEQLNFYAPHTMEKLSDALKEAKKAHANQQTAQAIKAAAQVLTLLENGQRNKAEAQKLLAPVFEQKQRIDEINSQAVLPSDYQSALNDIQDLIGYIEEGKKDQAVTDSADVIDDLKTLERNTMLAVHWQPAVDVLEQAEDEDADDHAKKTYADAEQKVETAQEFISVNFADRIESQKLGLEALRASQRALFIGRESQELQKLDAEKAEQAALKEEERLRQIGIAVGVSDLRYMALTDQSNAIIEHIQTSRRENTKPDVQLVEEVVEPIDEKMSEQLAVQPEPQQQIAEEAITEATIIEATINEPPATEQQASEMELTEETNPATAESVPQTQGQESELAENEITATDTQVAPATTNEANDEIAISENATIEETNNDKQGVASADAATEQITEEAEVTTSETAELASTESISTESISTESVSTEPTSTETESTPDAPLVQQEDQDQAQPSAKQPEVSSEVAVQE